MNNEAQQMVQRYAYLATGCERASAAGRQPPQQVVQEMNRLYSRAQAMLTPQEQQHAVQAVETLMAQHHQQAEIQSAQREANASHYHRDQLAKELTGMTADQLLAAKDGKKIPTKGSRFRPDAAKAQVMHTLKQAGYNLSYTEFQKLADKYNESKGARGSEAAIRHLSGHGDKAEELANVIEGFSKSGLDMAIGLQDRRGYDKDSYREVTDDEQLRAQIADAWAREAAHDEGSMESITQKYDPAYLEDEHMTGDIS